MNIAFLFEGGGETVLVFFSLFFKENLEGGKWVGRVGFFVFLIFCYSFIIWKFFCYFLFILEGGRGHEFFFIFFYS